MVEITQDKIISAIVRCDIDLVQPDCYDKLDAELKTLDNGTESSPWIAVREDMVPTHVWDMAKPVKCADQEGRWRYVVTILSEGF